MNPSVWLSLGGVAAVFSALGALGLWLMRIVIRDEVRPLSLQVGSIESRVGSLEGDVDDLHQEVFKTPRASRAGGRA